MSDKEAIEKFATFDTSILQKSEGFWSKSPVYINSTDKVVLLKNVTADELARVVQNYCQTEMLQYFESYMLKTVNNYTDYFDKYPEWCPTLRRRKNSPKPIPKMPKWSDECVLKSADWKFLESRDYKLNGKFSSVMAIWSLKQQGKTCHEIAKLLTDEWIKQFGKNPGKQINITRSGVDIALTIGPWHDFTSDRSAEQIFSDLVKIYFFDISLKSLNLDNYVNAPHHEYIKAAIKHFPEKMWDLYNDYSVFNIRQNMESGDLYRQLCMARTAAGQALYLFRMENLCVLPYGFCTSTKDADLFSIFERIIGKKCSDIATDFRTAYHARGLGSLIASSTINSLDDLPLDIRTLHSHDPIPGYSTFLMRLTSEHATKYGLDIFSPRALTLRSNKNLKKYSRQWIEENLSDDWNAFLNDFYNSTATTEDEASGKIQDFMEWAYEVRGFQSPCDIKRDDLRGAQISQEGTFHKFIESKKLTGAGPYQKWHSGERLYECSCNAAKLPAHPLNERLTTNPFKGLSNPYTSTRKATKTPRSRMGNSIHDAMIQTLLDPDENGMPTYKWARENAPTSDFQEVPDPENPGVKIKIWNPARACCLGFVLVLPPRQHQSRWIDQGLMDEEIYDPDSRAMVPNTHPLHEFKYENGNSHLDQYGSPSGVIQFFNDDILSDEKSMSIWINSNKTQMWNPGKKTGYELPWPDGSSLEGDDEQIKKLRADLRLPYEILEYQLRWVNRYDPNPVPIRYIDVTEDSGRVPTQEVYKEQFPRFVPLFRDLDISSQITTTINGKTCLAAPPVSTDKLTWLYHKLAIETQRRLEEELGRPVTITKTTKDGIKCIWDPHSLRVQGISKLIEMGVPIHIVSEYIAGHAGVGITFHYNKFESRFLRSKLCEVLENTEGLYSFDDLMNKIATNLIDRLSHLRGHPRFDEHIDELPKDYSAYSLVPGGVCPMGGRGSRCNEGGLHYKIVETGPLKGDIIVEFGQVEGGCGNCRFFLTGPSFLIQQAIVANELMLKLRSFGRERKDLIDQKNELLFELESPRRSQRKAVVQSRIIDIEDQMRPLVVEWHNRYELFRISEEMLEDLIAGSSENCNSDIRGIVLAAQSGEEFNLTPEVRKATDFALARETVGMAIIERRRGTGIPTPEIAKKMLEEYVDKIMIHHNPEKLFLKVKDSHMKTEAVEIIASQISALCSHQNEEALALDDKVQRAIDSCSPLEITAEEEDELIKLSNLVFQAIQENRSLADVYKRPELMVPA